MKCKPEKSAYNYFSYQCMSMMVKDFVQENSCHSLLGLQFKLINRSGLTQNLEPAREEGTSPTPGTVRDP